MLSVGRGMVALERLKHSLVSFYSLAILVGRGMVALERLKHSIVNNPQWKHLNIYTQNSRFATERDLQEKEDILLELSTHHYINFQMAGDVWSIYVERK